MAVKSKSQQQLGLAETIARIKEELIDSHKLSEASGSPAMFRVQSVTIEVKFVIRENSTSGGGVDIKLIAVRMDDKVESEKVHTVTVSLSGLEPASMGLLHNMDKR
jgi:hypothetical protein